MARVIGHVDLDYFYAQVEEVENPAIRGKPVVVCVFSGRTEDSGVVSTANYIARGFGVVSGVPIVVAKRKLQGKNPMIVRLDIAKYRAVSDKVMDTIRSHVDILEKSGIDEAFFDLTKSSHEDYESAVDTTKRIKESILEEEHLTCSVGLGRSKVVAKLGSDMAKPGGLVVVPPESTKSFLGALEASKLYGVGPKTAKALEGLGVRTVAELVLADTAILEKSFGKKLARYLHDAANGEDDDPVEEKNAPSQFSRIITLKRDTSNPEDAMVQLADALEDLRLKLSSNRTSFRTLTAIAILPDLSTKTKSKTFETSIRDLSAVNDVVAEFFSQLGESTDMGFRRVGIRVSDLSTDSGQKSLADFLEQP